VTSCREELGYTRRVETSLGKTESRPQTGTAGSDNDRIVLVVLQPVSLQFPPRYVAIGGCKRTMTGYLLLTKGEASLARSGWFAKTLAEDNSVSFAFFCAGQWELPYQQVLLLKRLWSGLCSCGQAIPRIYQHHHQNIPHEPRLPFSLTIGLASLLIDIVDAIVQLEPPVAQANRSSRGYLRKVEGRGGGGGGGVEPFA
jgi:hypothetical protein